MKSAYRISSRSFQFFSFLGSSLVVALGLAGCEEKLGADSAEPIQNEAPQSRDPGFALSDTQIRSLYSSTSCTGFDGPVGEGGAPIETVDYEAGIKARVTVPPAQFQQQSADVLSEWGNLDRFDEGDAVQLPETLFFNDLNVPTRAFTSGFPLLSGGFVSDAVGEKLVEYFRMDFEGLLTLPEGEQTKNMEFAILSDDGVRMKLGQDEDIVIDSPEHHPTRLACGSAPVNFVQGEYKPLNLSWFQGPRYHIALVMLWREARADAEPLCGQQGNDYWFNSKLTPSEPQPAYTSLATRGWKVVPAAAFKIPRTDPFNPCLSERVQEVFSQK